jgi:peptidoglycan/xylan/chitin deacetylase (PgdA/CDA1 family)
MPSILPWPESSTGNCPPFVPAGSFVLHVPVLMYHRIIPSAMARQSLPQLVISPRLFAAQIATLHAAGWRTITLATLAADLLARARPPARTFVITIDDGHRDGYTYAFPILQRYRLMATYFIVTRRLSRGDNLGRTDVRKLAASGMEIADHTANHADLPMLSRIAAEAQIEIAARTIAALIGHRPTTFAYPFGAEDPAVVALVHAAGFAMAVTTQECDFESASTALQTPRLRVGPETTPLELLWEVASYSHAIP